MQNFRSFLAGGIFIIPFHLASTFKNNKRDQEEEEEEDKSWDKSMRQVINFEYFQAQSHLSAFAFLSEIATWN